MAFPRSIERQQRRLEREGFTVPVTTLAGWWTQAADLLRPLHTALVGEAMGAWLPQVDATGLDVLEHDGNYPGDVCASVVHPGHEGLAHERRLRLAGQQREEYEG